MLIGVPTETTAGETRVAVTPETAKKIIAQGHVVKVQSGAGVNASVTDAAYEAAGAQITAVAQAGSIDLVSTARGSGRAFTVNGGASIGLSGTATDGVDAAGAERPYCTDRPDIVRVTT